MHPYPWGLTEPSWDFPATSPPALISVLPWKLAPGSRILTFPGTSKPPYLEAGRVQDLWLVTCSTLRHGVQYYV